MYLVILAWGYVVLMMALAEATSPNGSLLGAFFTLLGYGVLPMALVLYLLGTPLRRRARHRQEAGTTPDSGAPDGGTEPPAAAKDSGVAPMGKEP